MYKLISPENEIIEFERVDQFIESFGLTRRLFTLLNGSVRQYKGWRLFDEYDANLSVEEKLRTVLRTVFSRAKQRIVKKSDLFLNLLNTLYPSIPLNEQIYLFEQKLDKPPLCANCGNVVIFHSEKKGYFNTCSKECMNQHSKQTGQMAMNVLKIRQKFLDKYNVDNISKSPEINLKKRLHFLSKETIQILDSKELLSDLLCNQDVNAICKSLNVSDTTISVYAQRHGIRDGFRSNIERSISDWLDSLGLTFHTDRKILNGFEIDRLCVKKKFGIEIDGLFTHSEISGKKSKYYHKWKTDECHHQGIRLIHVYEDEWYDKKEIVKTLLKTQLGLQEIGVGARNLRIELLSGILARKFLEQYHIQGSGYFSISIGAYYANDLVAVMCFGHPTRQSKYDYELKRFCTDGKIYPGVGSKLFRHFVKNYHPNTIVSFCDNRYFIGNSYLKMGFILDGVVPPDYTYTRDYRNRHHKSGFRLSSIRRKFHISTENKTEWECMKELGYDRVWDCGKKRFIWTS